MRRPPCAYLDRRHLIQTWRAAARGWGAEASTRVVARISTVAFQGIEVLGIDVQVQLAGGFSGFHVVGLPDKAVGESRDRVRAALAALGLSIPARRVTVNLAPADVLKEGSHFARRRGAHAPAGALSRHRAGDRLQRRARRPGAGRPRHARRRRRRAADPGRRAPRY
jgi:hypothetical protein